MTKSLSLYVPFSLADRLGKPDASAAASVVVVLLLEVASVLMLARWSVEYSIWFTDGFREPDEPGGKRDDEEPADLFDCNPRWENLSVMRLSTDMVRAGADDAGGV
jgi:hypothetical protein